MIHTWLWSKSPTWVPTRIMYDLWQVNKTSNDKPSDFRLLVETGTTLVLRAAIKMNPRAATHLELPFVVQWLSEPMFITIDALEKNLTMKGYLLGITVCPLINYLRRQLQASSCPTTLLVYSRKTKPSRCTVKRAFFLTALHTALMHPTNTYSIYCTSWYEILHPFQAPSRSTL